jgi:hypothetical protein
LSQPQTAMTCSLRSTGITPLHHYYEAVRPWAAHRYFRPLLDQQAEDGKQHDVMPSRTRAPP